MAAQFARLGCGVVDADKLAKVALTEPRNVEQIRRWWGEDVLDPAGAVDRKSLAALVFAQPTERQKLESLIHPAVLAARRLEHERMQADSSVRAVIEDTPLLLEKNLDKLCDVLIYVDTPRAARLERVARTRGWDDAELTRREKSQLSLDTKRARSDHVLDNSGDEAHVFEQVRRLLFLILQAKA